MSHTLLTTVALLAPFPAAAEEATTDSILASAQRWLHPEQQTAVVVADAARFRGELEAALDPQLVVPLQLPSLD